MNKEMQGKVCLVTGGTSGIGKATALALAKVGATVVVSARTETKAKAIVQELRTQSGNQAIDFVLADFASQAAIRQMAEEFKARYTRLDVLINNAGSVYDRRELTSDGIERTFAVNVVAPFLLTQLLLDQLLATGTTSAPARLINVSSGVERTAKLNFSNLQGEQKYSMLGAYNTSKLAILMLTYEQAARLKGQAVTVNALEPGIVATNLNGDNRGLFIAALKLAKPFMSSAERGAETSVYLATSPEVTHMSGQYFSKKKPVKSSKISYDEPSRQRLWQLCEELTGASVSL